MSKTVLITGACAGMGKGAVIYFSGKGRNVIASMRSPEKEKELTGSDSMLVSKLDVQDTATIEATVQAGIQKFGKIDVVINNAGYGLFGIFEAASEGQVRDQFEVNVFGVMNVIRAILPHFRENKAGLILNISSGAGRFTLPLISLYAASKFALEGFSEALAYELSFQNIIVKIIEPGGTDTNFNNVTSKKMLQSPALNDYDGFMAAAGKVFAGLREWKSVTADEGAEGIYQAATDGTDRVRDVIGNEGFMKKIEAREKKNEAKYVKFMRQGLDSKG